MRHGDLWGSRASKYEALGVPGMSLRDLESKLEPHPRYQMFYPVDNKTLDAYDLGFSVGDFFVESQIGLTTSRDHLAVDFSDIELAAKLDRFLTLSRTDDEVRAEFFGTKKGKGGRLAGDTSSWNLSRVRTKLSGATLLRDLAPIAYRPFDFRSVVYRDDFLERPRQELIPQLFSEENFALSFNRKIDEARHFSDVLVFDKAIQLHSLSLKESNYFAPLYLYPAEDELDQSRKVNFDPKLYAKIQQLATHPDHGVPDEVAVFDYIYGVLHSPDYRQTFAEFLKIDFPRIPWPTTPDVFWSVAEKGGQLRQLHLMEDEAVGATRYPLEGDGSGEVEAKFPKFEATGEGLGEVWINGDQRFTGVPQISWDFYIGGYQPAQKWLKDRRGRALSFDDIRHYQKIIKILSETDRIMKDIELPLDLGEAEQERVN